MQFLQLFSIFVVCPTPPTKLGVINEVAVVEVGQNYTYRCQPGLFKKGDENATVTCLPNGSWTSTNFTCVKQNWMQDKIYLSNIHTSEVIIDETGVDMLECMQRCDNNPINCLSFFYDNLNNRCVLSSSFRRGIPQGFQFSDGLVYYTAPSASCDMGYSNVSLGGSYFCIKFYGIYKTFNEAMKTCESEKAKLIVVTTQAQIVDLHFFIPSEYDATFIGISDETNEGNWVSWEGEVVSPLWMPGEPNNANDEDCAAVYVSIIATNDVQCNSFDTFVCNKNNL